MCGGTEDPNCFKIDSRKFEYALKRADRPNQPQYFISTEVDRNTPQTF